MSYITERTLLEDIKLSTSNADIDLTSLIANQRGYKNTLPILTTEIKSITDVEIVRPANVTPYSQNDIINGDGCTILIEVEGTAWLLNSHPYARLTINTCTIMSNNGSVAVKLLPIVHIFQNNTVGASTLTDNTLTNFDYEDCKYKLLATIPTFTETTNHGSGFYELTANNINRTIQLNDIDRVYIALIANNAYIPTSGEKIRIKFETTLNQNPTD